MKTSLGQNDYVNGEFFSLASQLYVRLRRQQGRVIDSVYMTQNQDYAQEILRLARVNADADMAGLIRRIEQFFPAVVCDIPVLHEQVSGTMEQDGTTLGSRLAAEIEDKFAQQEVPHHYIGALR
ncbi:MAG: hypothetical protein EOO69_11915 [Moraxellaceae bacterium]|nr:MAG: hypothetical protein EOO69_11915 [Moraxellaceae bacterium]